MHTEDTPTAPGLRAFPIRRAYGRTFDDMSFDTPINAVTYVGTRKSAVKARRFERTVYIWLAALTAGAFAIFMTFAVNSL